MNIEFTSALQLPGIRHKTFPTGHTEENCCYESTVVVEPTFITFGWNVQNGQLRFIEVGSTDGDNAYPKGVKTFAELKTFCNLLGVPYPKEWPC